jgi:transposase
MIKVKPDEQEELEGFIRRGKANARTIKCAHILLKSGESWSIERIAETFGVSAATVSNVRRRYREAGIAGILKDKIQQRRRRALSGSEEAVLVAIACSPVPEGHDHWTVRMLQDKLVELGIVEHIGRGTVHALLKKMNLTPGNASTGASRKR